MSIVYDFIKVGQEKIMERLGRDFSPKDLHTLRHLKDKEIEMSAKKLPGIEVPYGPRISRRQKKKETTVVNFGAIIVSSLYNQLIDDLHKGSHSETARNKILNTFVTQSRGIMVLHQLT
jgi:hypothetical protein